MVLLVMVEVMLVPVVPPTSPTKKILLSKTVIMVGFINIVVNAQLPLWIINQ